MTEKTTLSMDAWVIRNRRTGEFFVSGSQGERCSVYTRDLRRARVMERKPVLNYLRDHERARIGDIIFTDPRVSQWMAEADEQGETQDAG